MTQFIGSIKQTFVVMALSILLLTLPSVSWGQLNPTRKTERFSREVYHAAFSPDARTAAFAMGDWVELWDVLGGRRIGKLENVAGRKLDRNERRSGIVKAVCFSPDGKTLAVGANLEYMEWYPAPWNREQQIFRMVPDSADLVLFDVATQARTHTLRDHDYPVIAVAFSPDGKTFATGSADKSIKLWDAALRLDRMTLQEAPPHFIPLTRSKPLAFSPDSSILASGDNDGMIQLWDRARGVNRATWHGHAVVEKGKTVPVAVYTVAFSPDGKMLASGGLDGCVRLWDVASGKNTLTLRGHAAEVNFVAFNPKGTLLASGGRVSGSNPRETTKINLWHMPSGAEAAVLVGPEYNARNGTFTPNGRSFIAIDTSRMFTWDLPRTLTVAEK